MILKILIISQIFLNSVTFLFIVNGIPQIHKPNTRINYVKINQIISNEFSRHTLSPTLHFLDFSFYPDSDIYVGLLSKFPAVFGDRLTRNIGLYHTNLYSRIFLFWLKQNINIEIIKSVKTWVNRRRDPVIIIGYKTDLEITFSTKIIQELREKVGFSVNTQEILVDPFVYNGGELTKISDLDVRILGNPRFGGNLRGRHFKVAGCEYPPWNYKHISKSSAQNIQLDGSHYKMIEAGAGKFNYTFETSYNGFNYGLREKNGTWTGMYSQVYYPHLGYHMTMSLSLDISWSKDVDYPSMGLTVTTNDLVFIIGHPQFDLKWSAFLRPLDPPVWLCTFIVLVFLSAVQGIVMYLRHGQKVGLLVIDSATIIPISIFLEQGLTEIPKGVRYLSLILLLGGTVITTGYRSTLRTNLAFPKASKIPMTYKELSAQLSDYQVMLHHQGNVEYSFIMSSKDPYISKIREQMIFDPSVEHCIYKTFMENFVCITWSPMIDQEIARKMTLNTNIPPVIISWESAKRLTISQGFQKDSQFVDAFFGILAGMTESGIYKIWELEINQRFKSEGKKFLENQNGSQLYSKLSELSWKIGGSLAERPLTFESLKAVFGTIVIGAFLAFGGIACELFHFKKDFDVSKIIYDSKNDLNNLVGTY